MKEVDRFIPVTEAKNRLLDLVRDLQAKDDIVAITKNGVPAAVLLSVEKFEGFLETIDILSDERAMTSLRRSLRKAMTRFSGSSDGLPGAIHSRGLGYHQEAPPDNQGCRPSRDHRDREGSSGWSRTPARAKRLPVSARRKAPHHLQDQRGRGLR